MKNRFTLAGMASLALATLGVATAASAQSSDSTPPPPGVIDCSRGGHGADCQVQLGTGQTEATILFEPTPRYIGERTVAFRASTLPGGPPVPVASHRDWQGVFRYTWSGTANPSDTLRVLVQTETFGVLASDTIHLLPPKVPPLRVSTPGYDPHVWLREAWVPRTIRAEVKREGGGALTLDSCESTRFAFYPRGGGTVEPDTGSARWEERGYGAEPLCLAETRWKLGDATGGQQLRLVVGDGDRVTRHVSVIDAYARQAPRIAVGYGYFSRFASTEELFCSDRDTPRANCDKVRFEPDTLKREFDVRADGEWQPLIGVEFPIFTSSQPSNRITKFVSKRLRLIAGSSFTRPVDNAFFGVTVIPLYTPSYEGFPVQVQAGWRMQGGFVGGATVDGSALISSALKALGAPL